MLQVIRFLADEMNGGDKPTQSLRLSTNATVDSVDPGAATDGHDQLVIALGGDTFAAPYLQTSGWTPTAGDVVAVLFVHGSPLVLGHVIGTPTL